MVLLFVPKTRIFFFYLEFISLFIFFQKCNYVIDYDAVHPYPYFFEQKFFPGYGLPSIVYVEIQLSGYKNISLPIAAFLWRKGLNTLQVINGGKMLKHELQT